MFVYFLLGMQLPNGSLCVNINLPNVFDGATPVAQHAACNLSMLAAKYLYIVAIKSLYTAYTTLIQIQFTSGLNPDCNPPLELDRVQSRWAAFTLEANLLNPD